MQKLKPGLTLLLLTIFCLVQLIFTLLKLQPAYITIINLAVVAALVALLLSISHKRQQSETLLQINAIFDAVLDGLIVIDDRGIIQKTNISTSKIFGYSQAEMIGQNVKMLMPEKEKSQHDGYLKNYAATREAKIIGVGRDVMGKRKDGVHFEMHLTISETIIDNKRMYVGTTRDISGVRKMEKIYQMISENVRGYATLILDEHGIIKTWNEGARALKGYNGDEIIGKSFEIFYSDEDLQAGVPQQLLITCVNDGFIHTEGWRVRKDGSRFYADIVINALKDQDGALLGFVKVTRDVSERKRAETELNQAYANLDEFTSVASHDLKSPLRGIAELIAWVKEELGSDVSDTVKRDLERIDQRVGRMEDLIDDLLKYSQASRQHAETTLVDPALMIHEIIEMQPHPPGIFISVNGAAPAFLTAKTPLQTILRNIIHNAIKHHDQPKGVININIALNGSYYVFEIKDDGPGIPEAAQARVFKLFQTLTKTNRSSGLGLAFSKRMAEAHGGSIELISNRNERGALFRVLWPRFEMRKSERIHH